MPVVDLLAAEYGDRVAFVAPAWNASFEDTARRAAEILPSGIVQWGLDDDGAVFEAFGVPYQPVTVLIGADKTVVETWAGVRSEAETRAAIERLVAGG